MRRLIPILCIFSCVNLEMQTYKHQMYISRKSRSNSNPTQTGFVYSRVGKGPGIVTTFDNAENKLVETHQKVKEDPKNDNRTQTTECNIKKDKHETDLTPKQLEELTKAETKCRLSTGDKGTNVDQSVMNNEPSANSLSEIFAPYNAGKEFRIDDEDVRTDSRNTYNGWPFSYQSPYQYHLRNMDTRLEKANDKRFLVASETSVIPVHENIENDIPNNQTPYLPNSDYYKEITTDNPIYGNQPFFSFVLNDYFDKHSDEDPLIFKDFTWGEEFDQGVPFHEMDDSGRQSRRIEYPDNKHGASRNTGKIYDAKTGLGESVTEKEHESNEEYDNYIKSIQRKNNQDAGHDYKGQRLTGFKNFLDSFANKFGSEDLNKNSKFMLKQNQDKGEKRKGFRRVYHKDEYQEDNEFYDNTNNKAHAEENGGSNFKIGGTQGVLQSNAAASVGNEANLLTKKGNVEDKTFENNNVGTGKLKGFNTQLNRYIDVAKNAALSNNADYIDQYST